MRLALPPCIAGKAWAVLFECARSSPFLAVYGATGLHPLLLILRSVFIAVKSAALLYAFLPRLGHHFSPTVQSLWVRLGTAVARLDTPGSLVIMEQLLICVIYSLRIYEAKYMRGGGFGDPCLLAMNVDCFQSGLMALYLTPFDWRQLFTPIDRRQDAGGAPVFAEIFSYDQNTEGGAGRGEAQEVCVICLDEFAQGDKTARLSCGHIFHERCICLWVQAKGRCPLRCELADKAWHHASA